MIIIRTKNSYLNLKVLERFENYFYARFVELSYLKIIWMQASADLEFISIGINFLPYCNYLVLNFTKIRGCKNGRQKECHKSLGYISDNKALTKSLKPIYRRAILKNFSLAVKHSDCNRQQAIALKAETRELEPI
ncbi:hypothetical protein BpHYR1_040764 [Brachionus plicatilis]|uniref:Uncharacterized protein n=1 Tax=Brachionus plicatilis TaxID=10195 RepID=A0A3M7PSK0_BRAPC|nr:hypothetical protein BpHYR1_040764 [Brachionus plicatilis]